MRKPPASDGNARVLHPSTPRRWLGRGNRGLVLLLAGLLSLLFGIFAYATWRDYQATLDGGWQMAERGTLGAAEHARRTISVARLTTLSIVQDVRRDGLDRVRGEGWEDLVGLVEQTPEVSALWVVDARGDVVASSLSREPPAANWAERPFFPLLRDGAESYLMPLTWGMITRNWFLSLSVAIRDRNGTFLGIAQSALFTHDFSRAYAELDLPLGARAGVFRAVDGAPMILWPAPAQADRSMPAPRPPESDVVVRLGPLGEGGATFGRMEPAGPDGPMMLAWRRFTEGETLVAALAVPRAFVLAPFHERLRRNALVLLLSALPLGGLGWITARAQRRAALSEARYRGTFEQAAVGVAHVGLDGRWLRANVRLCNMLGYTEAELRQRTVLEFTHPDDRAATLAMSAWLQGGNVATFSLRKRYLRKDGTTLWTELTASLLRDEATGRKLHGVAVIQDIGARMAAEAALAVSEERLALASSAAGMGVYDVDTRTGDAVVNAEYRRVYGLPPGDDVLPRAVRAGFIHPDDRARVIGRIDAANREGVGYYEEFRILRQGTGEVRWLASRGSYVAGRGARHRFIGVTYDITDRIAAEEARAESERRLALACAAVGLGVFDVDTETGFATVNAEWRRLYGLPPSDEPVSIEERFALAHPDDRGLVETSTLRAYGEQGSYDLEFRIVRRDTGEVRWVHSRGAFVDAGPRPRRFLGLIHDITERKREQEREMLLAREVDHRARNVLAVVRSIVKLSRADDPRQFADAVEGRVSALARAHTLLARDRWTGADLAEVAREELAAYGAADGTARVTLDGPPLRLRPEAVQPVSMALHELATNAAKHGALSTPSGRVALSWHLDPPEAAPGGDGGRIVLVWQEDGGPEPEDPPARRGFGSIVVEATVRNQLGGDVGRDWAPTGLRCEIAIPADRALADVAADAPVPDAGLAAPKGVPDMATPAGPGGWRVLVVEDEPLVALDIATTLEDGGCEVVGPAGTLQEALEMAGAQAANLDAAVLDANLHGESSRPVAALLSARGVPVIFVTGYSSLPSGAPEGVHLLSKPLRDGVLLATLREVVGGAAVSPATPARPATASAGSPS